MKMIILNLMKMNNIKDDNIKLHEDDNIKLNEDDNIKLNED